MSDNCDYVEVTTRGYNMELLKTSLEALVKQFKKLYPDEGDAEFEATFRLSKIKEKVEA